MPLEERQGDLFAATDLSALAHGCNCAGRMGKGIAIEFRRRWPEMYEEYRRRCAAGSFRLGDVFAWDAGDRTIFNLGTQHTWRTKAELWAIEQSARRMVELAQQNRIESIGLPRIGAGLGGLDWDDVQATLERIADYSPIRLIVFELLTVSP